MADSAFPLNTTFSSDSTFTNPTFSVGSIPGNVNVSGENALKQPPQVLRYPLKQIGDRSDYLEIKIVEYVPPGFTPGTVDDKNVPTGLAVIGNATEKISKSKEDPKAFIFLPIPQNISDQNSVSWGDGDTLDPLQAFGVSFGSQATQDANKALERFKTAMGNASQESRDIIEKNKSLIGAAVGAKLTNAFGGNVGASNIIARASGKILNPNLELLFTGVNLRTFRFIFDFAARDRKEGETIKQIIRTFKKSMAPKTDIKGSVTDGIFISAPDVFVLTYRSGRQKHPFLNTFKPCALVDMSISYTGSNTYATYEDGTPVHIQMTLTFSELNPIYAEDYQDTDVGVGY